MYNGKVVKKIINNTTFEFYNDNEVEILKNINNHGKIIT